MEVKYKLNVVDLKVTITRYKSGPYAMLRTITEEDVEEINNYVRTHELGIRIAYDMWKFKNKQSLTLFMLKYG